ncbi:MAG: HNH endonuclease, partial [Candidatus Paceibacterota bacterium]
KSEEHRKNLGLSHLREKNHYWKGGTKEQSGYRMVIRDRATPSGMRYVMEHRQIAEKALGRPLKFSEVVHHINGCKSDNRNANLLICDKAYHGWLHRTMSRRYQNEHFHIPSDFIESGASLVDA